MVDWRPVLAVAAGLALAGCGSEAGSLGKAIGNATAEKSLSDNYRADIRAAEQSRRAAEQTCSRDADPVACRRRSDDASDTLLRGLTDRYQKARAELAR